MEKEPPVRVAVLASILAAAVALTAPVAVADHADAGPAPALRALPTVSELTIPGSSPTAPIIASDRRDLRERRTAARRTPRAGSVGP